MKSRHLIRLVMFAMAPLAMTAMSALRRLPNGQEPEDRGQAQGSRSGTQRLIGRGCISDAGRRADGQTRPENPS